MLDVDPFFVEADCGDTHLAWNSPCRNMGNDSAMLAGITGDFEGEPRTEC